MNGCMNKMHPTGRDLDFLKRFESGFPTDPSSYVVHCLSFVVMLCARGRCYVGYIGTCFLTLLRSLAVEEAVVI